MNRNTVTGFVLIALVLIGFSWWNTPSQEQLEEQRRQDSIAQVQAQQQLLQQQQPQEETPEEVAARLHADSARTFFAAMQPREAESVVLKNEKIELTISAQGGIVTKAKVLGYKDKDGNPDVTLFDGLSDQNLNFILSARSENINTADLYFTAQQEGDSIATLTAEGTEGKRISIRYWLGDSYLLHYSIRTEGMNDMFEPGRSLLSIEWRDSCRQQEKGYMFENRYADLTYKELQGGTDHLSDGQNDNETTEKALSWVAFKTQFFSMVFIPRTQFEKDAYLESTMCEKGSGYLKKFKAQLKMPFNPGESIDLEMYFGPNDFQILKNIDKQSLFGRDLDLEDLVYLGWWLVRWINRWFTLYVFDGLTALGLSMGIVLILITLLLKALTFPMVKKSYMSSAKMRVLKPKIEEATKQYDKPEDQMQKQQAMMQIYSK